ncbi:exosome complex exonuclease exoribonuclease-like protein [Myxozyma melibiosi]|uniref:Exosome complex exonuclease exoribonuclease-like protein n=1 Tax=Myxozyma melibiosi TaxID=54550 RepID=A0ABR1FBB4_9ASCO
MATGIKRHHPDGSSAFSLSMSQKVYVRSRKGKATKIVQEHYLRTDIPCSSQLCPLCILNPPKDSSGAVRPAILSRTPPSVKPWGAHYLIPDTNIFVKAMDLMEHKSAFYDVIVLQTVLDELRNISLPLYNRLRALSLSQEKRFYVFHNEFRQETFVERLPGESVNDKNDRAIRTACAWYRVHLDETIGKSSAIPEILLVSNDNDCLRKAKELGVACTNLESYVKALPDTDALLDMIVSETSDVTAPQKLVYQEYYSTSRIQGGIKAGIFHQGVLSISQYNYLEGSVSVPSFERPLLVLGRESLNRAMHGDVVVVEVLPESEWKQPSTKIVEEETITKDDNPEAEDDDDTLVTEKEHAALQEKLKAKNTSAEFRIQPTAKVVGVIRRNWGFYVGHIDASSISSDAAGTRRQTTVFLIPMDKRISKIKIRTRRATGLVGKRILAAVDSWDASSRYPLGHFIRVLGDIESKEAETEALLLEYNVQYQPFTQSVLDCLPAEGHDWKVPTDTSDPRWTGREDLRELLVCSIDPPGCQDIDDALHARVLPNGNYEVGVHIADVSHFVKPDTAMDLEASSRGTTVYLVDKRIDMLPVLLGTNLCSLMPYVERFAFSAIWEMTPDATIVSTRFTKSVIRSKEAFSYEQAQLRIDDKSHVDSLTEGMRILLKISKLLRQKRMDAGALNLASPEVKVRVESEQMDPVDVEIKKAHETNSLVEEFMLLANISVAAKIYDAFPQSAMLRRHAPPPKENFEVLADQLRVCKNMTLNSETSKKLADSLDSCVDSSDPFLNTLIRIMATRCMLAAEYFCSGTMAESDFRHYGLASEIYTHWTSPIRRYADIVAHRQLASAIAYEPLHESLRDKPKLERVCQNINQRHRNAQFAGRASVEYYIGQALKNRELDVEGYVMKVFSNGFVVFIPQFGIEGPIHLRDMKVEYTFDEANYALEFNAGTEKEVRLQLFDKVTVHVETVLEESTGKRKVALRLQSPQIE